jgi:hypothetical protein
MIPSKINQPAAPHVEDTEADIGFNRMREAFVMAKRLHPQALRESCYILAGRPVRMRILGRRLAELMDLPFAHVRAMDSFPPIGGLTIELWDRSATGVPCQVGSPREDLDLHPILKQSDDGAFASYQLQHTLVCLDRRSARMIGCASNADELSLYERGRPLHVPLSLWHKSQDTPLVHAGLVAKEGRGVLLAGPGGSGKSTSAITSACAGFDFLSDDLVAIESSPDGGFMGHSLYSSTFMEPDHLMRFSILAGHALTCRYPFERKHLVLLSQITSLRFAPSCRICALVLPRVCHLPKSHLRLAAKGEALMALAPSSLLVGDRSRGRESFNKQVKLVETVPCYHLELGGALDEVPQVLDELLSEIAGR